MAPVSIPAVYYYCTPDAGPLTSGRTIVQPVVSTSSRTSSPRHSASKNQIRNDRCTRLLVQQPTVEIIGKVSGVKVILCSGVKLVSTAPETSWTSANEACWNRAKEFACIFPFINARSIFGSGISREFVAPRYFERPMLFEFDA